jgi:hypothetical protein
MAAEKSGSWWHAVLRACGRHIWAGLILVGTGTVLTFWPGALVNSTGRQASPAADPAPMPVPVPVHRPVTAGTRE